MTSGNNSRIFTKAYSCAEVACESHRRTHLARQSQVNTPAASYQQGSNKIDFERIDGTSGVSLLKHTTLEVLLAPLKAIQESSIDCLPRFDPFLRIDPRIRDINCPQQLIEMTNKLRNRRFSLHGVVHGDYHFGQLILDREDKVWLLDLDDLAMGPSEADLGNLIAHLATREETKKDALGASLTFWHEKVVSAWLKHFSAPDKELLFHFTQIAIIRRALKKVEQGNSELVFSALAHYDV